MKNEIIVSGFGGQGILAAGRLMAQAALRQGKFVSWLPSYGPEKRGGTSNCHVIISDEPVGSPFITDPDTVIAMSTPAFNKYHNELVREGLLICDSLAIKEYSSRDDVRIVKVPATQISAQHGLPKMANMILLGKLISLTGAVSKEQVVQALYDVLPEDKHILIPDEIKLLEIGIDYGA